MDGGRSDGFTHFPMTFMRKGTQQIRREHDIGLPITFTALLAVTLRIRTKITLKSNKNKSKVV